MAHSSTPVCLQDFELLAQKSLPPKHYEYFRCGSHPEQTLRDNTEAFLRYRLRPRVLRDVSSRDLRTTVLGHEIAFPVAVAPMATQCLAHITGEVATASAIRSVGTLMALSAGTTKPMEEVAAASSPEGLLWAQFQIFKDRSLVRDIVEKAERNGYKALVVTVDCPVHRRNVRNFDLPPGIRSANFSKGDMAEGVAVTWNEIDWLHTITTLPIILKGILTGEDAQEATNHNVAGIVVSNHGARNFDGTLASIDALSEVVEAVRGSNIEVYMDGGVRTGTDVLKALALGARAVFIGRPVLWGLAYDGEKGVRNVLEIIRDEFSYAMAQTGCSSVADINSSLVGRAPQYTAKP